MFKRCPCCGEVKSFNEFHKNSHSSDGLQTYCKVCRNSKYLRAYKLHKKEYDAKRYNSIKEERKIWRRDHYLNNKRYYKNYNNRYYINNKDFVSKQNYDYNNSDASFELFKDKLTVDEAPILSKDGFSIEVRCKYCGKYFVPKYSDLYKRVYSLNNLNSGTSGFVYCSEWCKKACPIFGKHKFPKGFKKATSREVQSELRQIVLERDSWTCQKCGETKVELHCHHITGVEQNPIESADIDNCITLCKKCHKEIHKQLNCTYSELRCKRS